MVKIRIVLIACLFAVGGCDRLPSGGTGRHKDVDPDAAERAKGQKAADAAVRDARIDVLEARVSTLENQVDRSEDAAQDTRLDLIEQQIGAIGNISSTAAPVTVPMPLAAITPPTKAGSSPTGTPDKNAAKPGSDHAAKRGSTTDSPSKRKRPSAKTDPGPGPGPGDP